MLALTSDAVSLKRLVGYTSSEYVTFSHVLSNPSLFIDTVTLQIAEYAAKGSLMIRALSHVELTPEYLFLFGYFSQNLFLTMGCLMLAWMLSGSALIALIALSITIFVSEGYFFSARTNIGFLSLGFSLFFYAMVINSKPILGFLSLCVVGFMHPTQAAVVIWSALGSIKNNKIFWTVAIILSLCVASLIVFFALNFFVHGDQHRLDFHSIKPSVFALNDNSLPLKSPLNWLQWIVMLLLVSRTLWSHYQETSKQEFSHLALIFLSAAIISIFSMIVHVDVALPHSIYAVALNFRVGQIFDIVLCLVIPCLLLHKIRSYPETLPIKIYTLVLMLLWSPSLFKGGTLHSGHVEIYGSILFLSSVICLLCDVWEKTEDPNFFARVLIALSLIGFSLNYDWWLPLMGLPLLYKLRMLTGFFGRKGARVEIVALMLVLLPFQFSGGVMTNYKYLSELLSGYRQLHLFEERIVPKFQTSGPMFNVPLRGMELTPKYPAFIERLDTTYSNLFPSLNSEIWKRLSIYTGADKHAKLNEVFKDGFSWRGNLDELRSNYPEVQFIAMLPKYLCPGEEIFAKIKDTRLRQVLVVDVNKAYSKCD